MQAIFYRKYESVVSLSLSAGVIHILESQGRAECRILFGNYITSKWVSALTCQNEVVGIPVILRSFQISRNLFSEEKTVRNW